VSALSQLIAELVTALVLIALISLAATEYMGARVPGFHTISDPARAQAAMGDYRLFVGVLLLFLLGGCWWTLHILWRI
jgi:hypothetical protein